MEKALFAEFPPITDEQWQKLVLKELKGAAPETLEWNSPEGIAVAPYYRANDTPLLAVPKRPAGEWLIRQDIDAADAVAANLQALDALQRGATALLFMCKADTNVEVLLKDVLIEHIQTDWLIEDTNTLDKLTALINARGLDAEAVKGSVQFNPADLIVYFNQYNKLLPGFKLFTIASDNAETLTEQTALQLKAANDVVAKLTNNGIEPTEALSNVKFDIAVGTDHFFEMARIRVLRSLWAVICQQYTPGYTTPALVHATNKKVLPEKDGYYEMIRQTTQALSAVIGGTDSLSIVPHIVTPDRSAAFQTRIARNIQLVLQHESHLDTVADPAAGSYYIEAITSQMATNTWKRFVQLVQAV
jgi:methylmalonyl-CoA mutase